MSVERKLVRVNRTSESSGETSFFNPGEHKVGDSVAGVYMGTSQRKQINPKYKDSLSNTYHRFKTDEGNLILVPSSTVLRDEMAKIEKGTFVQIILTKTYEEDGYYGWDILREAADGEEVAADESIEI